MDASASLVWTFLQHQRARALALAQQDAECLIVQKCVA
eukprot:COSAG02_NODE_153_length_33128_cov_10.471253_5_plen_38_part_00